MKIDNDEESILIYLESCLVNKRGRVEGSRMNSKDFDAIKRLKEKEFLDFSRLKFATIQQLQKKHGISVTHWVTFTDEAWEMAHRLRKERAERMQPSNSEGLKC